ncbi:hypothetical protein AHF37_11180 [Paragonimus kellicotti]|nr:hypothetical protein AHF37_11180 [Paragonimus kellicotti]
MFTKPLKHGRWEYDFWIGENLVELNCLTNGICKHRC